MHPLLRELPRRAALPCTLLLALLGVAHFFDTFPNGWDPTEYAWCVRDTRLPHSPYVAYILLAQGFGLLFEAPVALSLLSLLAGLGALLLVHAVRLREGASAGGALVAVLLLASTHVFIRQSGTQEVYALQTAGLLGSVLVAGLRGSRAQALGGALFGTTLAVHQGSLFIAPALAYRVYTRGGARAVFAWGYWAAATLALWYVLVGLLLPYQSGETAVAEWLGYLRGISPGFGELSAATLPTALGGLLGRISDPGIPMGFGPVATGPTGLSVFVLCAALAGVVFAYRRRVDVALFWCLYAAFYFVYEVTLGAALDWGVYLPMVAVPVCVLASEFVEGASGWIAARVEASQARGIAQCVLTALLVAPALGVIATHWSDPEAEFARHHTPNTLAAMWLGDRLPPNAILIVPPDEPNANAIPYYAKRTPVMFVEGRYPTLHRDRGPYTPLSPRSYEPLGTAALTALLDQGVPVYGFAPDPLTAAAPRLLDPARFEATHAVDAQTGAVYAARFGLDDAARIPVPATTPIFAVRKR